MGSHCTSGMKQPSFSCSLLSRPTCAVLEALGSGLSFELAVGMNGKVWVRQQEAPLVVPSHCHTNHDKPSAQAFAAAVVFLFFDTRFSKDLSCL